MNVERLSFAIPKPTGEGQWAAVAIIIDISKNSVMVVKRIERDDDPWSGDIAFPGGKYVKQDGDLVETAKRETFEETGINLNHSNFKGVLQLYEPSNEMSVHVLPSVFTMDSVGEVKLSKYELESVHWIPLDLHNTMLIKQKMKGIYENWTLMYNGIIVWGMTYRILKSLLETLEMGTLPWDEKGGY